MANKKCTVALVGVDALEHADGKRRNIPTAACQSLMADAARSPSKADQRRPEKQAHNLDPDPLLVGRGKDDPDWTDLQGHDPTWTNRVILGAMRLVGSPSGRPA